LYAFTNRHYNKIKCLMWEDNGFVLYYKSLAEDKFKWPTRSDDLLSLTGEQINWLLDGYDISLLKGHQKQLSTQALTAVFLLRNCWLHWR
ncbi:MAG: transposase, partial [Motiliproteus sp.]